MKNFYSCYLAIALMSAPVFADDLQLGEASYEGTACPSGSLVVSVDQNQKDLHFMFNPIVLEVVGPTGRDFEKKTCEIVLPVTVPKYRSIAIAPVEFQGTATLPSDSVSQLSVVYSYEYSYGTSKQSFLNKWYGQQYTRYSASAPRNPTPSPFWSACGTDMNLRISISLETQTQDAHLPAIFTLSQIGNLAFQTKSCR